MYRDPELKTSVTGVEWKGWGSSKHDVPQISIDRHVECMCVSRRRGGGRDRSVV